MNASLLLLLLASVDLTGPWLASRTRPDGGVMETQYVFKQTGTQLTGSVFSMMGEQKIVSGEVKDDGAFWFEVEMNMMGQARRMKWEGKVDGEQLKLKMVGGPPMGPGPSGPGPGGPGPGGPGGPGSPGGPRGMMGSEVTAVRGESARIKEQRERDARRPKPVLPAIKVFAYDGLAKTPPMGWNSWNKFRLQISDKLIRETADMMVSTGLRDAGYVYLNLDDGWQGSRHEDGRMKPNERFPDMKALGDYIHSKGLKFGIYTSPGPRTCGQQEGSYGYEELDAKTFAAWGVDYVKYDWCSAAQVFPIADQQRVYQKFGEALRATGRPIVYSLCQYGANKVEEWGSAVGGHLWRTTFDIRDSWASMAQIGFAQNGREKTAGPGKWNDPDMLEVGNGGLNFDESKTHFSLWAMLASPLLLGNDLRNMSEETRSIILNKEVIAINQDAAAKQGYRVASSGETEVWMKPLAKGETAVAMFNRGDAAAKVGAVWADLGVKGKKQVRDLWAHRDLSAAEDRFEAEVPAHGVVLVRLK